MPKKVEIIMTTEKVCKPSVRYATKEPGAAANNIYVNKTFAETMPEKIKVTIEGVT